MTLDQILRAYAAAGGRIVIREVSRASKKTPSGRAKKARSGKKTKKIAVPSKVHIELIGCDL